MKSASVRRSETSESFVLHPAITVGASRLLTQGECAAGSMLGSDLGLGTADDRQRVPGSIEGSVSYVWMKGVTPATSVSALNDAMAEMRREEEKQLPENLRVGNQPRPVFMLLLGTISKMHRLRVKEGRIHSALSRLCGHPLERLNSLRAYSPEGIIQMARSLLGDQAFRAATDESAATTAVSQNVDPDWEVFIDHEEERNVRSELFDTLCNFVRFVQHYNAILYIPDFLNEPQNTGAYLFDEVLELCDFDGPIIVSAPTVSVAFEADSVAKPFATNTRYFFLPGIEFPYKLHRWPCLRRTTHFIGCEAGRDASCHAGIAASVDMRVARLLAGWPTTGQRPVGQQDGQPPIVAILINGGKLGLWRLAAAAQAEIPILLVEGSGRLCNALPRVWVRRSNKNFDALKEADCIMAECGFPNAAEMFTHMLQQVLRSRLLIHSLKSQGTVLLRVLQREFRWRDVCFMEARDRCLEYHAAAEKFEQPSLLLHATYLIGAIIITTLTVVHEQYAVGSEVLRYTLASLPVLLSVFVSLRKDLDHSAKAIAFRYGAACAEKHLWQYCTQTGPYSSTALSQRARASRVANDIPTARAELLTEQLYQLERSVIHPDTTIRNRRADHRINEGDMTIVAETELQPLDEIAWDGGMAREGEPWKVPKSDYRVSNHALRFLHNVPEGPIPRAIGDTYVLRRLKVRLREQQAKELRLQVWLVSLKVFTYVVGATGSVLSLVGLSPWVAVTTAITTSAAAWDAMVPMAEQLRRSRCTSRELSNISLSWNAKNDDKEWQETLDALVETSESAIMYITTRPTPTLVAPSADILDDRSLERGHVEFDNVSTRGGSEPRALVAATRLPDRAILVV